MWCPIKSLKNTHIKQKTQKTSQFKKTVQNQKEKRERTGKKYSIAVRLMSILHSNIE